MVDEVCECGGEVASVLGRQEERESREWRASGAVLVVVRATPAAADHPSAGVQLDVS